MCAQLVRCAFPNDLGRHAAHHLSGSATELASDRTARTRGRTVMATQGGAIQSLAGLRQAEKRSRSMRAPSDLRDRCSVLVGDATSSNTASQQETQMAVNTAPRKASMNFC